MMKSMNNQLFYTDVSSMPEEQADGTGEIVWK